MWLGHWILSMALSIATIGVSFLSWWLKFLPVDFIMQYFHSNIEANLYAYLDIAWTAIQHGVEIALGFTTSNGLNGRTLLDFLVQYVRMPFLWATTGPLSSFCQPFPSLCMIFCVAQDQLQVRCLFLVAIQKRLLTRRWRWVTTPTFCTIYLRPLMSFSGWKSGFWIGSTLFQ